MTVNPHHAPEMNAELRGRSRTRQGVSLNDYFVTSSKQFAGLIDKKPLAWQA